jgi:hypothetical protein
MTTLAELLDLNLVPVHPNMQKTMHNRVIKEWGESPFLLAGEDKDLSGLEVEIEGIINPIDPERLSCWTTHIDGSLRDSGLEFVSLPLLPKYTISALRDLADAIKVSNPEARFSWRTGFHNHLNVSDLTLNQFVVLLILYSTVEFLMFKMTTEERMAGNFCVPVNDTNSVYKAISMLLGGNIPVREVPGAYGGKYAALGMFRLQDLGTLEFRHLHGNLDIPLIYKWLTICLRLKQAARIFNVEDLRKMFADLNTHSQYQQYVQTIIGDALDHLVYTISPATMSEAIANAKQVFCRIPEIKLHNLFRSPMGRKLFKESGVM